MSYDTNPYSNPENHGLEIVGTLEDPNDSWDFDYLVVWKNKKGEYFYAKDSGCSCPFPFEEFEGEETLTRITKENYDQFKKDVHDHCGTSTAKEELLQKINL